MIITRPACRRVIPGGISVKPDIGGACRQLLARVIPLLLIVTMLPAVFLLWNNGTAAAATSNPIVGDWDVTYGAPAVVRMTLDGGVYTETARTPVEVVGSSCELPAGTVIASFSETGPGTYAGQHGLWFVNDCSFDTWADATFTLSSDGSALTAEISQVNETITFTKVQRTFTVKGSNSSPLGQAGKQATGSPADAAKCETAQGQQDFSNDEVIGQSIVNEWQADGLTTASVFLEHFLTGQGTALNYPQAAAEIEGSSEFTSENNNIIAYIAEQLAITAARNQSIQVPAGVNTVHALGFVNVLEPDLDFAFGRTHLITVKGSGSLVGTSYTGSLTYVVSESYGFSKDNTLLGIGTAMRYLQTTCGYPYYPAGAHWFTVSVSFTVPFSIPI